MLPSSFLQAWYWHCLNMSSGRIHEDGPEGWRIRKRRTRKPRIRCFPGIHYSFSVCLLGVTWDAVYSFTDNVNCTAPAGMPLSSTSAPHYSSLALPSHSHHSWPCTTCTRVVFSHSINTVCLHYTVPSIIEYLVLLPSQVLFFPHICLCLRVSSLASCAPVHPAKQKCTVCTTAW